MSRETVREPGVVVELERRSALACAAIWAVRSPRVSATVSCHAETQPPVHVVDSGEATLTFSAVSVTQAHSRQRSSVIA